MKTMTAVEFAMKERTELKSRRLPLRFGERAVERCAAQPRRSGGSAERRMLPPCAQIPCRAELLLSHDPKAAQQRRPTRFMSTETYL